MDKYRKVIKPREENVTKDENEIRVTATGSVSAYISRAAKVYGELAQSKVVIKATGNALTKAVTSAEVIKRRFKGLHQITNIGSTEIVDEYEPIEEGLDKVTQTRQIPFVEITLSKDALSTGDKGYQAPIDESLVTEVTDEEMMKPRGRGKGRGKGKAVARAKEKAKAIARATARGKAVVHPRAKVRARIPRHPRGKAKAKVRARKIHHQRAKARVRVRANLSPKERERVRASMKSPRARARARARLIRARVRVRARAKAATTIGTSHHRTATARAKDLAKVKARARAGGEVLHLWRLEEF